MDNSALCAWAIWKLGGELYYGKFIFKRRKNFNPSEGTGIFVKCELLAAIILDDGAFHVCIADNDFRIIDESMLDVVFGVLEKTAVVNQHHPAEQLGVNLDEYSSGIRCDLCLGNKIHNENDFSGSEKFHVMNRHCYYTWVEDWGDTDYSKGRCDGKQGCYTKTY